jgi:two-component system, NarL family, response regulator LiaR
MNKENIRVLVVDDHPIVRRGLCSEISYCEGMCVVGEAEDGFEAVDMALLLMPTVILMDLVLPRKNGLEAIREIMQRTPDARILVLTSFFDDERVYAALEAGATGYILKDRHPDEVLAAIRKTAGGEPFLNPNLIKGLMREMRTRPQSAEAVLTERELEVLAWVAKGTPNKEIAFRIGISQATVRAHVSNILSKLRLENRSQMVLYAVQHGLVENGPLACVT